MTDFLFPAAPDLVRAPAATLPATAAPDPDTRRRLTPEQAAVWDSLPDNQRRMVEHLTFDHLVTWLNLPADQRAAIVEILPPTRTIPAATVTIPSAKLPARYAEAAASYAATRAAGNAPYRLTDAIVVNVPNPKRPGTAGYLRYSLWHTGMTVAAYLDALERNPNALACRGYGPTDLTYNLKRGLISVRPA